MPDDNHIATNVGIILLAAGASERLGRPKQLLTYRGKTLLEYTLHTALASGAQPVIVVLGANADIVQKEIEGENVHVVVNDNWREGMASSIQRGIRGIKEISPFVEGIILMVCDQPYVSSPLLKELLAAHRKNGKQIIACRYENTFGPPVFFHHSLFPDLLELKGDVGARSIIGIHTDLVETIPFPKGTFDVDTEHDYEKLKSNSEQ